MIRYFVLFLTTLAASAQLNISNPFYVAGVLKPAASGGGGPVTLSDNFTGDGDISGRAGTGFSWVEQTGSMDTTGGQFRVITGSFADNVAIANTSLASVNQYVLVNIVTTVANGFPHIMLRYTDASSPYYTLEMQTDTGNWQWYRYASVGGSSASIGSVINLTHAATDRWGITITGTGTSTHIRLWKNPTANAPVSAGEWDSGDTTPDGEYTDDPASAVDTGNFVGLEAFLSGGNQVLFDDFYAGGL